jgi:hypothetical protein
LWGLGLLLLPVLIHFLRRRRIKVVRLPTFEFLLRTQRRIAMRSQLKNWILLALRISAVSLVVFLAARPLLSGEGWAGGSSWSPLHLTLLIDNSASMAYRTGKGTRFELAKRAARRLIGDLSSIDRASVLTTAEASGAPLGGEGQRAALARLESVRQTDAAGDGPGALQRIMAGAPALVDRRSLIVLSDFAKSDWEGLRLRGLRRVNPHMRVQFVRVAPEAGTGDTAIMSVRRRPWPPRAGSPFAVVATVANRGKTKRGKVPVSLFLGGAKAGFAEIELEAGEEKKVSFRVLAPSEGSLRGRIELGPDQLSATNRRYFSAEMGRRSRVLIIDGEPRRGLVDSESFYFSNALSAAPPGGDSPILVEVVAGYEMGKVEWSDYDLVIACNVGEWQPGAAGKLRSYVEEGGGFLLAGGKLAEGQNPGEGWMPASFGASRTLKPPQGTAVPPERRGHPVFSKMGSNPSRLFSRTRVRRLLPLKPSGGGKTLLTLTDGTPVLVAGRAGAGTLAVWGATCDREWTDIPVRPVFVPFLRGLVGFLGGRPEGTVAGIEAGRPILIREPAHREGEAVRVRFPSGAEETVRLGHPERGEASSPGGRTSGGEVRSGAAVAGFSDTYRAGFYEIRKPGGTDLVAVNVPSSEGALEPLGDAEIRGRLPGLDVTIRGVRAEESEPGGSIDGRVDLGIFLFFLLAGILISEGALADRS